MIVIIKGCGSNIASIEMAFARLGKEPVLTTDVKLIQAASHVILPGVGTAKHAMLELQNLNLIEVIRQLKQPVLGICLGMQLLHEFSEEGDVECLGILPGKVALLPQKPGFTRPHMGWNQLRAEKPQSPLLQGVADKSHVYFVHSYAVPVNANTIASTTHSAPFSAMVQYNNFFGAQFHPERSGTVGELILKNFCDYSK